MSATVDTAMLVTKGRYERVALDAYFTPRWCTEALISKAGWLPRQIWEPAAGRGDMADSLARAGFEVQASDIHDHDWIACDEVRRLPAQNFLDAVRSPAPCIVTNPPYADEGGARFIEHALKLTEQHRGMVAMLLRNEFDSAKVRRPYFAECPAFRMKIVLTKRPLWFAHQGNARHNFAWYVWDHRWDGAPVLKYAP